MKFIDEAKIEIISGHGGKGCVSFRREKYIPRGGPDGGNGGAGANVVFEATDNMSTLMDFRYKKSVTAPNGQPGQGSGCDGRFGDDAVIPVPTGTIVFDEDSGDVLYDFKKHGERHVMAKGGRGGKGNAFFTTSTRQAPKFAQEGEEGETRTVRLELRLLADVGLIGFPNAGKSTFLSVISQAKPKVADYPFTTLQPCLGVAKYKDGNPFVVTDLPGLIEGAHEGKGMGDQFLKHAERTRVLLHLISLSPFEPESPIERYRKIEHEVNRYFTTRGGRAKTSNEQGTDTRKRIVLLTQIDLVEDSVLQEVQEELKAETNVAIIPISSVTNKNIDQVMQLLGHELG